jgi:hypothetical protein
MKHIINPYTGDRMCCEEEEMGFWKSLGLFILMVGVIIVGTIIAIML